jgi:hypothetical protein
VDTGAAWAAVERVAPRGDILGAVAAVEELVPDDAASLVPPAWQRAVYRNPGLPADTADRDAYVLCILEQLYRALRRRDIFAAPSCGGPTCAPSCSTAMAGTASATRSSLASA